MVSISKTSVIFRIVAISVLGLVLLGLVWYCAWRYLVVISDVNQLVVKNPILATQKPIDVERLNEDYLSQSSQIITEYLAVASSTNPNLAVLSHTAQASLLNLTLPAQYKARHLAEVLLLGEIADLISNGNPKNADKKINDLRQLFEKN